MAPTKTLETISDATSTENRAKATRSSLACLPCRSRHLKCDGKRPYCSRCTSVGKPCSYAKSRRGGLARAALAARRDNQKVERADDVVSETVASSYSLASPPHTVNNSAFNSDASAHELSGEEFRFDEQYFSSSTASPNALPTPQPGTNEDTLLDSYYQNFHAFHPFVLPREHLSWLLQDSSKTSTLAPLISVMRLVGACYSCPKDIGQLKSQVEECIGQPRLSGPFMVQAHLLYSIPLFWHGNRPASQMQMEWAIDLATQLGMFRREFAYENGDGNPVIEESWRRTWWQMYVIDGFYAATTRSTPFKTRHIEATVELPCETAEYESGMIPCPKTLEDFDSREFALEKQTFSSFTYLITSVRCGATAMEVVMTSLCNDSSPEVIDSADSIIEGWLMLLPEDRQQVMNKSGEIDELMFQAHMAINAALLGLHRPFSDLRFDPVESVSSCATERLASSLSTELINIHTVRCLKAIRSQVRLLALPVRPFSHSPFITCATFVGTLGLLSACKFVLRDRELAVARDQIRMTIGCLKVIADIWPQTARNLQEIQTIAQDVLGLKSRAASAMSQPAQLTPPLPDCQTSNETGLGVGEEHAFDDLIWGDLGNLEPDTCLWFNLNDMGK